MVQFLSVFYSVFQIWLLIAVGFIARKFGSWTDDFFRSLSRFLIRIVLPVYFVVRFARWDSETWTDLIVMPLLAVATAGVGLLFSFLLFQILPFKGADKRAGLSMAAFGNSAFVPLALAEIITASTPELAQRFDVSEPLLLIGAFVAGFSPLLWAVGGGILTHDGRPGARIDIRRFLPPPIIGVLIGIVLSLSGVMRFSQDEMLPLRYLLSAADKLAAITLPLALINLGAIVGGLRVDRDSLHRYLGVAAAAGAVRLLVMPGIFFALWYAGLLHWAGPAMLFVIFLELNTPPATTLSLIATEAGVNRDHTAVTLLITYAAYMILMPVYLALFLTATG